MVDMFLEDMNRKTLGILRSQQEFAQINTNKYFASYSSPGKAKSPQKENSPLKKMGELRKQSR